MSIVRFYIFYFSDESLSHQSSQSDHFFKLLTLSKQYLIIINNNTPVKLYSADINKLNVVNEIVMINIHFKICFPGL